MSDIDLLAGSEEIQKTDHIWRVTFDFKCQEDESGEWCFEEINVAGGGDAQAAIDRVRQTANDVEEFGCNVTQFRLRGVKLLAEADL